MSTAPDKPAAPAIAWAVILLIPLLLSCGHVPLWARADATRIEAGALASMLAVQFAASAMLFPWLMRGERSALFAVLLSAIFLQLAAMVGGARWEWTYLAIFKSCMWLSALRLWTIGIRDPRHRLIAAALATALVVGFWLIQYLSLEFGSGITPSIGDATFLLALLVNFIAALIASRLAHRQPK